MKQGSFKRATKMTSVVDVDVISRALGVEPRGKLPATSGYFGARAAAAAVARKPPEAVRRKLEAMRAANAPWIVNQNGGELRCLRCGTAHKLTSPIAIDHLLALARTFRALHRDCR